MSLDTSGVFKKKKIHLNIDDGSTHQSPFSVLTGTENILSQRPSKHNDFNLSYKDVCQWIREMLESNEDLSKIVDQLYKVGVLEYEELRAIYYL